MPPFPLRSALPLRDLPPGLLLRPRTFKGSTLLLRPLILDGLELRPLVLLRFWEGLLLRPRILEGSRLPLRALDIRAEGLLDRPRIRDGLAERPRSWGMIVVPLGVGKD